MAMFYVRIIQEECWLINNQDEPALHKTQDMFYVFVHLKKAIDWHFKYILFEILFNLVSEKDQVSTKKVHE